MVATIRRLSTSAVEQGRRLDYWNDAWASASGGVVVDADRESFQGVLTTLRAGRFEIASVRSTPAVTHNSGRRGKGDGEPVFLLQLVHTGSCRVRHNALETELKTGDLVIADARKPYGLAFDEPLHGLSAPMPRHRFAPFADALEAIAGRRMDASGGPGAVLSTFLRGAWDNLAEGDAEDWPESAEEVIWDLLQAVLQGDRGGVGPGRVDRLRREAKAHVDARLSDPGFDSRKLAEALTVSPRYLQMVFAEVGTTPSRFLLARRLEAAASRLRRSDGSGSITDVALECGFNDLSYFSRTFRRRFGLPPLSYRLNRGARSADWA